ncbi:MAG: nitronate monooxygenase, partial [Rikenellaceae bacterium]
LLREHILKCKQNTENPFGVNLPLMYSYAAEMVDVIIAEGVKIVFTSAGNPATYTKRFKENGLTVVHVVASSKFALKAQAAGVDAVVAEGFEAGGHNGLAETTTMVLVPLVVDAVSIPVIAAGGIGDGRAMVASMALGAEGVQVGTRFALCQESSASDLFKKRVLSLGEGETMLCMKTAGNVRMVKNDVFSRIHKAEYHGASSDELRDIAGFGRAKRGIFEGDVNEGFLEVGQIASSVNDIISAEDIVKDFVNTQSEILKKWQKN